MTKKGTVELKVTLGNEQLLTEINEKFGLETEEIGNWVRTRLILNEFRDRRFGRVDNLDQQVAEYLKHSSDDFNDQKLAQNGDLGEILEEVQNQLRKQIKIDLEDWLKQQKNSSYIRKL